MSSKTTVSDFVVELVLNIYLFAKPKFSRIEAIQITNKQKDNKECMYIYNYIRLKIKLNSVRIRF